MFFFLLFLFHWRPLQVLPFLFGFKGKLLLDILFCQGSSSKWKEGYRVAGIGSLFIS